MTPTLSVEATQERFICDEETAVAERLVGVEGAVVSGVGVGEGGGKVVAPENSQSVKPNTRPNPAEVVGCEKPQRALVIQVT